MLVSEMHIGIDLGLQVLNSSITKNVTPREKDWFLNNEVIKFINQRLDPLSNAKGTGFQDTAKRIEDLRDLYKSKNLDVKLNSEGRSYIDFPFDYFKQIKFDSNALYACNVKKSKTKINTYTAIASLNLPSETLATYTISVLKDNVTTLIFDASTLPDSYLINSEFSKQRFILLNALKIELPKSLKNIFTDFEVKIDESNETLTIKSTKVFDNIIVTETAVSETAVSSISVITKYSKNLTPLKSSIRIIDSEFFRDIANSSLSKASVQSPIGEMVDNKFFIEHDKSVVLGSVDIGYICKPNLIDIYLNSNLNVSNSVCKEIVSNTIRFLKGLLSNSNYQQFVREMF